MRILRCLALFGIVQSLARYAYSSPAPEQAPGPTATNSSHIASVLDPFRIKSGFRLELVAEAPTVASPVAMAFDENGRLFVAESRDTPDNRDPNAHLGRIQLLEDTDGDGKFDRSTIYADNLSSPSALACYGGGVFVAAGADILYLKDTGGLGGTELRKVVFSGFGAATAQPNPQALVNNFSWGLDNRIHAASGGIGGVITVPGSPGSGPVSLVGSDFSFDPRALTITPESGPSESGLCFDSLGREFVSDLTHPLRSPRIGRRYLARNPFFPKPRDMVEVANPATPIFRFIGTDPSKAGKVPPPGNGSARALVPNPNGLSSSWLTNARGCVIYRGNAFGSNYLENAFIADPSAHIVHRAVLREQGLDIVASRPADEQNTEFLYSRDISFHPTQLINGPDGALYVADAYTGGDSGRVFRIIPSNFQQPKLPQLGKAKSYDLVANLAQANGWQRDTAARLLYERSDAAAVALLTNMLQNSRLALARLHALHVLDGLGALKEAQVLRGLRDRDDRVREHAIRLSETLTKNGAASDALWNQLRPLTASPSVRVRFQLGLTLGEIRRPERIPVLAEILRRNLDDLWVQTAVLSSLAEGAGAMFIELANDGTTRNSISGASFLRQLALMLCAQGQFNEVTRVAGFAAQNRFLPEPAFGWLTYLGEGLQLSRSALPLIDQQNLLTPAYVLALNLATYGGGTEAARLDAIRLLGFSTYTLNDLTDLLLIMLGSGEAQATQSAAISTLGRFNDPRVAASLIARWQVMSATSRNDAVAVLLAHTGSIPAVLAAIENGVIRDADLTPTQANLLRAFPDPAISRRAVQRFGPLTSQRPAVIEQFRPALRQVGVASRGQQIFRARCSACHEIGGAGLTPGSDLAGIKVYGKERILTAILEPSAQVRPENATRILVTKEGEVRIGVLGGENLQTITLRQPNAAPVVVPRINVQFMEAQPWSLMPEGLEQGLGTQDIADLLEYLLTTAGPGSIR